jgi:hypothetical protein
LSGILRNVTFNTIYKAKSLALSKCLSFQRPQLYKTGGGSKKNNKENSSNELILTSLTKKTVQGLTNEFDCDATLESADLEVNKIKVKCAFVKHFLFLFFHVDLKFEVTLSILTLMTLGHYINSIFKS